MLRLVILVLLASPAAASSLDKQIIQRPIRAATPRIAKCYERQLAKTPTLEGKVLVEFTIEVDGRVGTATGTGMNDTVAACVAGVIRTLRFPRAPATIRVFYPFTFRPA